MSVPRPLLGPQSDWCDLIFPSPRAGLTVEWYGPCLGYLHTARLVCCFYGIWCICWCGSARCTVPGGAGSAHFTFSGLLREGPCSTGSGAGRLVRGIDPQKHSIGCLHSASNYGDRNWFPLGFWLGDGRGRWRWPAPLFPVKLNSVFWGSTPLPPVVLLPSRSPSRTVNL